MKASLIIPTYRRQHLLPALLDQVCAQTSRDFETLIIDQSPEADRDIAKRCAGSANLRYFHCDFASLPNARNIGAKEAKGEVLIFIDDDVKLDEGYVTAHLAAFASPELHATAGRISGGYDQGPAPAPQSVGRFSRWTATVSRNFHGTTPVSEIDQLPGGNFGVRRETYLKLGGFDLAGFGGRASIGEETDFACRLRRSGARIDFVPDAHLHHDHADEGGCRDDNRSEWTYWHGRNFGTLAKRYLPAYRWPVFWAIFGLRYLAHGLKALNPLVTLAGWRGLFAACSKPSPLPSTMVTKGHWHEVEG